MEKYNLFDARSTSVVQLSRRNPMARLWSTLVASFFFYFNGVLLLLLLPTTHLPPGASVYESIAPSSLCVLLSAMCIWVATAAAVAVVYTRELGAPAAFSQSIAVGGVVHNAFLFSHSSAAENYLLYP